MSLAREKNNSYKQRRGRIASSSLKAMKIIHGSFSNKKVSRKSPLIGGFHRAIDGALWGVLVSVGLVSAFTLHWQHLWSNAFTRLDRTRQLSNELMEGNALLERYLLESTSLPLSMVPTKAENLIYVESPYLNYKFNQRNNSYISFIKSIVDLPINQGY